jgi:hypothetical protein
MNEFIARKSPIRRTATFTRHGEIDNVYAFKSRIDENDIAPVVEGIGQVYAAISANSNLVKVGYTKQPIEKLRSDLQRGSAFPIVILASFFSFDPITDEGELHRKYASKQFRVGSNTEWFELSRDDIKDLVLEFRERNNAFKTSLVGRLQE